MGVKSDLFLRYCRQPAETVIL